MAIHSRCMRLTIVVLLLTPLLVGISPAAEFETPPTLPAQVLAPASLLAGNGFHVNNLVPTDGLLAHYTIQSDVGVFPANSTEMLKIRVAEIPAIQELTKTSKTKVFAQSLATNAARPVAAAGQMVIHPVETVKGLPSGVGRFFGRVGLAGQRLKELQRSRRKPRQVRRQENLPNGPVKPLGMFLVTSRSDASWPRSSTSTRIRRILFSPNNLTISL